jgi:hypothetical protein
MSAQQPGRNAWPLLPTLATTLAAVLLTGCCGIHQIKTSTEDGQLCHYVGFRCCPADPMGD